MERRARWGDAARLVLGFDGGCARCASLASSIRRCVGDRLEVGDLRSKRARRWRERALGQDAPWVPTLFEVRGGDVRAWTGIEMGLVLVRRLGVTDGLKVLRALGESSLVTGEPSPGTPAPATLRLIDRSLPRTARGAALALDALKDGSTTRRQSGPARPRRRVALSILDASSEYRELVRTLRLDPTQRRVACVAGGDRGLTGLVVSSAGSGHRVFAVFLVDSERGSVAAYRHVTVTDSCGERTFVDHRDGVRGEVIVVGDDYVVLPDGSWITPEEFDGWSRRRKRDLRRIEADVVYGEDESSNCLRRSYDFCMRVADRYRASWANAPGFGRTDVSACDYLTLGSEGGAAGCRAWARRRCYLFDGGSA